MGQLHQFKKNTINRDNFNIKYTFINKKTKSFVNLMLPFVPMKVLILVGNQVFVFSTEGHCQAPGAALKIHSRAFGPAKLLSGACELNPPLC